MRKQIPSLIVIFSLLMSPFTPSWAVMDMSSQVPEEMQTPSIYTMQENEQNNDLKVLVFKGMEDDEEQKIIAMTSSQYEEQKIFITSIPEDTGQKIIAVSLPEGTVNTPEIIAFAFNNGFFREVNILSFKGIEDTSLLKILTKKSRNRDEGNETDEEITVDDVEELSVEDRLDEGRMTPIDASLKLIDKETGASMQLFLFQKNEEGIQKGSLKIENPDGTITEYDLDKFSKFNRRAEEIMYLKRYLSGFVKGTSVLGAIVGAAVAGAVSARLELGLGGAVSVLAVATTVGAGAMTFLGALLDYPLERFIIKRRMEKYDKLRIDNSNNNQDIEEEKISHSIFTFQKRMIIKSHASK